MIGRFINADDSEYLGVSDAFISYNLFSYCSNNPIMNYDPDGHFESRTYAAVGLGIFLVGAAILTAIPTGGTLALTGATMVATAGVNELINVVKPVATKVLTLAKKSKLSGKESANDAPGWAKNETYDDSKSADQNARDVLNRKYGNGKWKMEKRSGI